MIDIKWDEHGLIPAVIQDAGSGEVLMVGYMNKVSLEKTLETGKTCFYSRSRKKIWVKGEESGHTQEVVEILTDCDQDTLVVRVRQKSGACHLGYRTCFVRKLDKKGNLAGITQKKVFDPGQVYKSK